MFSLPTGTVTFVLGDVEGSTQAWARAGEDMVAAMARLDRVIDDAVGRHGGVRPIEQGEGDSFVAAFDRPSAALAAAVSIQRALLAEDPGTDGLRMRIGVHTGEVTVRDGRRYAGLTLARGARIRDCGHGGQTLASATTAALVADRLPDGLELVDLGDHRLADLARAERIHQLVAPDLPADFPRLRVLDDTPNNLPVQLTSFVGRTAEVASIGTLLATNRLLTVTGPGGAGKTRVAVHAAAALTDRYESVWFVDLAGIPAGDDNAADTAVAAAVAVVVGARPAAHQHPAQVVAEVLGSTRTLLILDNCEHVVAAAARVSELILRHAPGTTVLATSRQPLGAAGEQAWQLPELSLPGPDEDLGPDALPDSDAVALFVDRARQVRPSFSVTEDNRAAVERICHRLDGIPLAIELAAARIRVLTPREIADAIDDRFRLLTGAPRTAVPRHATLRSSLEWGHELLDRAERVVFRRLGIFVGPFTLEDAEAVAAGSGSAGGDFVDAWHVLDHLATLVDRSMVTATDGVGTVQYRLLDSLRAFALERLDEAGERDETSDAHLAEMIAVARSLVPLHGRRGDWVQPGPRADDLEAALRWARDTNSPLRGELAARMSELWRDLWPRRALELAVEATDAIEADSDPPYGEAWSQAMILLIGHDAGPEGPPRLDRFREDLVALQAASDADRDHVATATAFSTLFGARLGEPTSREEFAQIAQYAERTGNQRLAGSARFQTVLAARRDGNLQLLEWISREILDASAETTDGRGLLVPISQSQLALGRFDEAEALAISVLEDSNIGIRSSGHQLLATAAYHRGDVDALAHRVAILTELASAAPYTTPSQLFVAVLLAITRNVPAPPIVPTNVPGGLDHRGLQALVHAVGPTPADAIPFLASEDVAPYSLDGIARASILPLVHRRLDNPGAAAAVLRQAVAGRREIADVAWTDVLAELAALTIDHGDAPDAARLIGIRQRHLVRTGIIQGWLPARFHDDLVPHLTEVLGRDRFDQAANEGRILPTPAATAVALSLADALVVTTGRRGRPPFGWEALTVAERRVVKHVAAGRTNKETAEALGVKTSTVHTHLLHVYAKLGVGNRAELAALHTREQLS